jgi:hypothetical protein
VIEVLGGMPKSVKTSEGGEIPFGFHIYGNENIPDPAYLEKKPWIYERMDMDKFLKALIHVLEEARLMEKVTDLDIRAYFSGRYIHRLVLSFDIDEWYHRETLDKMMEYLRTLDDDALLIQDASLFCGSFTIEFDYESIYIPFEDVEELLDDGE